MNVARLMADRAALGDRPAIVTRAGGRRERAVSFADLAARSARIGRRLGDAGVGPGSAVLMLTPLSVELFASLIGTLHAGATVMALDPSAGRRHVERCCARRRPDAVIGSLKSLPLRYAWGCLRRVPRWFHHGRFPWPTTTRLAGTATMPPAARADDDPAVLTFTSGSTGEPKAAVRSHAVLRAQGEAVAEEFGLVEGEADLTTLPMFVLANLAAGVTSVLPDVDLARPGFIDPAPALAAARRHACTTTAASPALLRRLAAAGRLPTMRRVFTGGAPVTPATLDTVAAACPAAEVTAVYGSTEAEPIAAAPRSALSDADRAATRAGGGLLAGRPAACADVRVIRDHTGADLPTLTPAELDGMTLGPDEPGEVIVAGPHVLTGYLDGVGDAATKIHVGGGGGGGRVWHRTGDAGRFDAAGRLWLLGRCVARVGDVYPLQVEARLDTAAALLEVDGRRVLFVEGSPDVSGVGGVSDVVDEVRAIDVIPLDARHNAKIDYPALRAKVGPR